MIELELDVPVLIDEFEWKLQVPRGTNVSIYAMLGKQGEVLSETLPSRAINFS